MLGFIVRHLDASKIELFHAQSGTAFIFPLAKGKPTGKYFVAPDLSGDFVKDQVAVEELAAFARKVAGLLLPPERVEALDLRPMPALPAPSPSGHAPT
jgi:hypothetical protein